MGSGRFSTADWDRFTTSRTAGRSTAAIFGAPGLMPRLDPRAIAMRESRDSADNPASTAIMVGLDVTGSMGMIADYFARDGLQPLFEEIYARRPVSDPHIAFMGIGDVRFDRAPLQVSQFEADIRIAEQLTDIYLEHGGGGNNWESYNLPWYFAAMHTSIDCFEKRGKKGYLFTLGDEEPPQDLTREDLERVFGSAQKGLTNTQLLEMAGRQYHVFHVIVEQGSYCRGNLDRTVERWTDLLGQRALRLSDYTRLSEVIVSAIQVNEGADPRKIAASWSDDTALVVAKAVGGLTASTGSNGRVMRF